MTLCLGMKIVSIILLHCGEIPWYISGLFQKQQVIEILYKFCNYFCFHYLPTAVQIKKPSIGTPPPNTCPVCGIQLASNELETHFLTELDRLYKLSCGSDRQRLRTNFNISSLMHSTNGNMQPGTDSRWETFQRIRTNRQSRLRAKTRKRKSDSESEFSEQLRNSQCQSCPVCHGRLQRTPEEIAQHVEECIRKVSFFFHCQSVNLIREKDPNG